MCSRRRHLLAPFLALVLVGMAPGPAAAQTQIQWWHSMSGALGEWVTQLAMDFNASQSEYRVIPRFQGSYDESLTAAIAAFRAGEAPHLLQVFEAGTATMMLSQGAIVPVQQLMLEAGEPLDPSDYVPAIASFYTAPSGQMPSLPFNVSVPVLHYNKDAFRAAGLDPDRPPLTWPALVETARQLKAAGQPCPFTTTWQSWTQLEGLSTWHGVEFATRRNGFDGLDARLLIDSPLHVRHIEMLADMARQGLFVYKGRGNAGDASYVSGTCAMATASSALLGSIRRDTRFESGISNLPYYPDVPHTPQATVLGGASLWVLAGHPAADDVGVARFLAYLSRPGIVAQSHQRTGYLPTTRAAFELTEQSGYYQQHPDAAVAVAQWIRAPNDRPAGIRLGNFVQIRTIVDEELELVWSGRKSARDGLAAAVKRGNEQLERFQRANRP